MYKVGLPFWKTVARAGFPVALRINVSYDHDAKVFIATSNDLRGLVVEARSVDELVCETNDAIDMLWMIASTMLKGSLSRFFDFVEMPYRRERVL